MTIAELRSNLGMSLQAFADAVGLKSKGQMLEIEQGREGCSVRVALAIERLSEGRISACSLNETVALLRAAA